MLKADTRIAGSATVGDWARARMRLQNNPSLEELEEIFDKFLLGRLESRYFGPIKQLEASPVLDGEGFAIVTLYCSTVEFLASIRLGKNYRHTSRSSRKKPLPHEYSDSQKMFVDFLRKQDPFKELFTTKVLAKGFYADVRCGLVHEACTKGDWKIRVGDSSKVAIDVRKKVIYRNRLAELFSNYINTYKDCFLLDRSIQSNFARKFDYLCDLNQPSDELLSGSSS
jgi:hypothetical protein